MGLDTDDIVAIPICVVSVALAIILSIMAATISTKYLRNFTKNILQLQSKNVVKMKKPDSDEYIEVHKSVLNVLLGDYMYREYLEFLKEENNGQLPNLQQIDHIVAPETIFLKNYFEHNKSL